MTKENILIDYDETLEEALKHPDTLKHYIIELGKSIAKLEKEVIDLKKELDKKLNLSGRYGNAS